MYESENKIPYASCNDYLSAGFGSGVDGVYELNNGTTSYNAYCDMTSFGGGWTVIAAQFEATPVVWTGGVWGNQEYDPTLQSGNGFTLSNAQIPSHIQFGWGQTHYDKFGVTDYVDFGESGFQYHTGNLSISTATFPNKDNQPVHLSRHSSKYYRYHEPDGSSGAVVNDGSSRWINTFVIDKANMNGDDWAFAPYANQAEKGYAFGGNIYGSVLDDGAYILWVR